MVCFVGAGPEDPELITIKGCKLLKNADVVIYAGSLVNLEMLQYTRPEAEIYNSAAMTLSEVIEVMTEAVKADKKVISGVMLKEVERCEAAVREAQADGCLLFPVVIRGFTAWQAWYWSLSGK